MNDFIKLLTYNVLDGGIGRESQITEVLKQAWPDVAILEEVYEARFVEELGRTLEMEPFFGEGNRQRHVALLSRLPISSRQSRHPYPPIWRNVIEVAIEYQPGKVLRVFGVHTMASLMAFYEWWRWREAKTILGFSQPYMAEPCLIAGDFNALAPQDGYNFRAMPKWEQLVIILQGARIYRASMRAYLQAGFTDSYRLLNPTAWGFTYPAPKPYERLDYILVNAALKPSLRKCEVLLAPEQVYTASDHFPVMAVFEL